MIVGKIRSNKYENFYLKQDSTKTRDPYQTKCPNDSISFTSIPNLGKWSFDTLKIKNKEEIFKTLMIINNEDGPMVEHMSEYFCKKNPGCDKDYIRKSVAGVYQEVARIVAKIASRDSNMHIVTALDNKENRIVGLGTLLPVGHINKQIPIYEVRNMGVLKSQRGQGIGTALYKKLLDLVKDQKALLFAETMNPMVRRLCLDAGMTSSTKNSSALLKALEVNYSNDWFLFKENNLENVITENLYAKPPLLKAWLKVWPDCMKFL